MIRLRRMLERGRRHPVLGPIVLVLLVLLVAMVCFHAVHDSWEASSELGAVCVGLVTILGAVAAGRSRWRAPLLAVSRWFERGPPRASHAAVIRPTRPPGLELVLPLRR